MLVKLDEIVINEKPNIDDVLFIIELANSIRDNGLIHPITISKNKILITGYKRLIAHYILDKEYIECVYGDNDTNILKIDENLYRKHKDCISLGELLIQRDEILEKQGKRTKRGDNRFSLNRCDNLTHLFSNQNLSSMLNLSIRTIQRRKKIARDIIPDLKDYLKKTEYSNFSQDMYYVSTLPNKIQYKLLDLLLNQKEDKRQRIKHYVNKAKKEIRFEEGQEHLHKIITDTSFRDENVKLYNYDFNKSKIQSNSIDVIFTDPPYLHNYLLLYQQLGIFSKRVLKDGGNLFLYCEKYQLYDVMNILGNYLNYNWQFIVYYKGSSTMSLQGNNKNKIIHSRYKPILWFSKGFPSFSEETGNGESKTYYNIRHIINDTIITTRENQQKTKTLHEWGQDITECDYILSNLTNPGDKLLEPFTGSGTTIISGLKNGLSVIGYEIDKERFDIMCKRVKYFLLNGEDLI